MNFYESGKKITTECGLLIADLFTKRHTIRKKGEIDLVTEADVLCEDTFIKLVHGLFPNHSILSEECGLLARDKDYMWIIDPIDGTTNFARRLPFFCISVGFAVQGKIQFGFVYAPVLNQFFEAEQGHGAFLNGRPIQVSQHSQMGESFLTTGFPYNIRGSQTNDNMGLFSHFSKKTLAVRRLGSAAIDICYVANGIFDGYWEISLHPWDFAGGKIILEEAGGKITDFDDNPLPMEDSQILASNSFLHANLMQEIKNHYVQKIDF